VGQNRRSPWVLVNEKVNEFVEFFPELAQRDDIIEIIHTYL